MDISDSAKNLIESQSESLEFNFRMRELEKLPVRTNNSSSTSTVPASIGKRSIVTSNIHVP